MPEINAIATIHGHAGFQRLAQFSTSTAAKELAGFTMRFDRIKVPSGGGTTYVLPEPDVNGNTDFREIDAVILTHHHAELLCREIQWRKRTPGMQQQGRERGRWLSRRKLR